MKEIYELWQGIRQASDIKENKKLYGRLSELVKAEINLEYGKYIERYEKNYLF